MRVYSVFSKNLIKRTMVVVIAVLVALALMSTLFFDGLVFAAEKKSSSGEKANTNAKAKAQTEAAAAVDTTESLSSIGAGSAVVFSASTSQLVYSLHEDRKLQPGNITKLMTAMVVLDNMHSTKELSSKIEITADAAAKDGNLPKAGKTMKLEELLDYMLTSGSDAAAELLANYSASSIDTFVNEMNSEAISIGLMNTQFANVTGAFSEEQYSSAYDCAVIAQYALRREQIKEVLNKTGDDIGYKYSIGSIKGTMDKPSETAQYLGLAKYKDMELVVVMLDANEKTRAADAERLFKYGYKNVSMNVIVKAGKKQGKARIRHGASTRVNAYTETRGYAYIPPEGSSSLVSTEAVMDANLSAPLKKGAKIGELKIYVADELKGTVDLVTNKDIKTGWLPSYLYISNLATVMIIAIILLIFIVILRILSIRKRNRKRRERRRQEKIREEARKQLEREEDRRRRGWTYH